MIDFCKNILIKNFKYNYEILFIDAIYKTNKYETSLIIINVVILLNIKYYVDFEFIFKKII